MKAAWRGGCLCHFMIPSTSQGRLSVRERDDVEITHHTWNPWRGCTKISPGCAHCYMFRDQARYGRNPAEVVRTKTWNEPLRWQKKAAAAGRDLLLHGRLHLLPRECWPFALRDVEMWSRH
jgi:hypothetical protein